MNAPRLFFFVQNLLGIGHVVRAARLSKAFLAAGAKVTLASGGVPVAGLDFGAVDNIDLPAIKAGPGGFSDLRLADGQAFDDNHRNRRRDILLKSFEESRADILLIEAFPFGRRALRFELLPLLEAARGASKPVLIASSVRDILQAGRSPERRLETVDLVKRYFDMVLVHGDGGLIPFEASFPDAPLIADRLVYTGMVGPPPAGAPAADHHDVIVAAGGGVVGAHLFEAALAARPLTRLANARWLIVGGPHLPDAEFSALAQAATRDQVEIARFLPDLPARYGAARLVISQAGYNTIADILAAGCRSVVVPFASGGESEQSARAALLSEKGVCVSVGENELSPEVLAAAIDRALQLPPHTLDLALNGAAESARRLLQRLAEARTRF